MDRNNTDTRIQHFTRLTKIIDSCITEAHIDTCVKMVNNYYHIFNDPSSTELLSVRILSKKKRMI
jgi:hypothetical protein